MSTYFEDHFLYSFNHFFPVFWAIFAMIAGIIIARFIVAWVSNRIYQAIWPAPKPRRNWDVLQPHTTPPRGD